METYYSGNFTVQNYNVPCCKGQHFIKFKTGKAVIPVWELFEIKNFWKKNRNLCDAVCPSNHLCDLHKKLNVFTFFSVTIRHRNINRNDVVSKIFIRDNCWHPWYLNSWCFKIYETEYVTDNKT